MNYEYVKTSTSIVSGYSYKTFFELLVKFYNFKKKKLFRKLSFSSRKDSNIFHKILRKIFYLFQENFKGEICQIKNHQVNFFLTYFILITKVTSFTYRPFFKNLSIFCKNNKCYDLFDLCLKSHLTYFDVSTYFFTKINEIYIYENFKLFYQVLSFNSQLFEYKKKEKKIPKFLFSYLNRKTNFKTSEKKYLYVNIFLTRNLRFKTTISQSVTVQKKLLWFKKNYYEPGDVNFYSFYFERLVLLKFDCNFLNARENPFVSNIIYWRYKYTGFESLCILMNFNVNKNIIKFSKLTKKVNVNAIMRKYVLRLLSKFSKFDKYQISYQELSDNISFLEIYKICCLYAYIFREKKDYFRNTLVV